MIAAGRPGRTGASGPTPREDAVSRERKKGGRAPRSTLAAMARNPILSKLTPAEQESIASVLERLTIPAGTVVVREDEPGDFMDFILDGEARVRRSEIDLKSLTAGDHYGELAMVGVGRRRATAEAATVLTVGRLRRGRFEELARSDPALAFRFLQLLVNVMGDRMAAVTDSLADLLRYRSLPRRAVVEVRLDDRVLSVSTGTSLGDLLPGEVNGAPVMAGLVDGKPVGLHMPVVCDGAAAPLTLNTWEGQRIYCRTVGLMLLEVARSVAPGTVVKIGPNLGPSMVVSVAPEEAIDRTELARRLEEGMAALSSRAAPFREELWTTAEARAHFRDQGWHEASDLLRGSRSTLSVLLSCGQVLALSCGPILPHAGHVKGVRVVTHPSGLLVDLGDRVRRLLPVGPCIPEDHVAREVACPRFASEMSARHRAWLEAMKVDSIGSFNALCIDGQVADLIRVAEGFHEKELSQVADAIAKRRANVRVITIAGPSSSGKTTFIKRLTVQLAVEGIRPVNVSLDDYFVDREKTVRDERGEYDFEALHTIDQALLRRHLRALLDGETVRTARYDFRYGKSLPGGGQELRLEKNCVLVLEGIHGLNPALLGDSVARSQLYKIFLQPFTTLPLDRLESVCPSDLRLLRRIVRDRHARGYKAADSIGRWDSVRRGEIREIYPHKGGADAVFDTALAYEMAVLKVYAERYLLEVTDDHPAFPTAFRLRQLIDRFVAIYPDHVPPTSIIREFIGGSGFEY
ncbi:MAG: cyclic nucleotide-binding domain-containing protein [Candidatus Riflebacteria bacterium]|nr:cyclic nucleotide-binding domain-containing protein [Candidatus Riflebacteria bacterium]